ALQRGIPVIPVLVDGARMPAPSDLPETLQDFAYRNAAAVDTGRDFHPHMDRLIRTLDTILDPLQPRDSAGSGRVVAAASPTAAGASRWSGRNRVLAMAVGAGFPVLGLILVIGYLALKPPSASVTRATPQPTATTNVPTTTVRTTTIAPPSSGCASDTAAAS